MTKQNRKQRKAGRGRFVLGGALLLGLVGAGVWAGDLPFTETFEDHPGIILHNQNTWRARRQNDAQTQSDVVFAGSRGGVVSTNALLWQNFADATATNVWVDFYGNQQWPTSSTPPELVGSVAAAFYVGADGKIRAISNNTWHTLDYTVPSNTWRRYSIHLDYGKSQWSLYVADEIPNSLATSVSEGLAFSASSTNAYMQAFRVKN